MLRLLFRLLPVVLMVLAVSCKKSELETITGNQPPPDTTTTNEVVEDYINRTYILVLGREPDSLEFTSAFTALKNGLLSESSRYDFLDQVFADTGYKWRQYDKWKGELLNNIDTVDVTFQIALTDFQLGDTTFQIFWPILQYERDRLVELQQAGPLYAAGQISIRELQSRMINNYFYDQINMGSLNFVLFSFQQILNRNPTLVEQNSGVSMVEGNSAVLFLQSGSSKDDYLSIFFNADDCYEGAVVRLYHDFLFRAPESLEMSVAALQYKNTGDYEQLQKDILATDEFVGID